MLQRGKRIAHNKANALANKRIGVRFVDDASRRATLESSAYIIVAVIVLTFDGEEQFTGLDRPCVDGNAADARRQSAADPGIKRADKRESSPHRSAHAACSLSASRIAS